MKRLFWLAFLVASTAFAAPYSKNIVHVLAQLREEENTGDKIPFIGGCAVGYAGVPGSFFLLHPYIRNRASIEDLRMMLKDKSPTIRLMAAKVLLHAPQYETSAKEADVLLKDSTQVMLAEFGCMVETVTVGEVVRQMKADKKFLGDKLEKALIPVDAFQETPAQKK